MDEPAAVLPELKLNHCWPSSGAYPAKIPLTTSTGPPVPPTVHPVKNVLPAERSLVVFVAICGASNPPLAKAAMIPGELNVVRTALELLTEPKELLAKTE